MMASALPFQMVILSIFMSRKSSSLALAYWRTYNLFRTSPYQHYGACHNDSIPHHGVQLSDRVAQRRAVSNTLTTKIW